MATTMSAAVVVVVAEEYANLNGFIQISQRPDAELLFFWKQIKFKENTMWWEWNKNCIK